MNSLLLINKGGKSSAEVAYINENYILKKKIGLFTGMEFHLNIISKDYKTIYSNLRKLFSMALVFVWEKIEVPRGNPPVQLGNHLTCWPGYQTRVT